jgi:hypothetical protein
VESRKSGEKVQFSGFFSEDAKIQPISGKSGKKFPGKSDVFGGKFPENHRNQFRNSENFGKKCQNVDFGRFNIV